MPLISIFTDKEHLICNVFISLLMCEQEKVEKAARTKGRKDQYVPAFRSAPYAFLITLLSHEGHPNFVGEFAIVELHF